MFINAAFEGNTTSLASACRYFATRVRHTCGTDMVWGTSIAYGTALLIGQEILCAEAIKAASRADVGRAMATR